jgi:hypothetical protein
VIVFRNPPAAAGTTGLRPGTAEQAQPGAVPGEQAA